MSNLLYEGEFIASKANVIVVTVTYRVGALGFLVVPGLKSFSLSSSATSFLFIYLFIHSFIHLFEKQIFFFCLPFLLSFQSIAMAR